MYFSKEDYRIEIVTLINSNFFKILRLTFKEIVLQSYVTNPSLLIGIKRILK